MSKMKTLKILEGGAKNINKSNDGAGGNANEALRSAGSEKMSKSLQLASGKNLSKASMRHSIAKTTATQSLFKPMMIIKNQSVFC